jgi:hypothetical protein
MAPLACCWHCWHVFIFPDKGSAKALPLAKRLPYAKYYIYFYYKD